MIYKLKRDMTIVPAAFVELVVTAGAVVYELERETEFAPVRAEGEAVKVEVKRSNGLNLRFWVSADDLEPCDKPVQETPVFNEIEQPVETEQDVNCVNCHFGYVSQAPANEGAVICRKFRKGWPQCDGEAFMPRISLEKIRDKLNDALDQDEWDVLYQAGVDATLMLEQLMRDRINLQS
jgi:hypothetical protein